MQGLIVTRFRQPLPCSVHDTTGQLLVAHPDLRVALLQLVALAWGQSPSLSYASSGTGGMPHIESELFKRAAGIKLLHIPLSSPKPDTRLTHSIRGRNSSRRRARPPRSSTNFTYGKIVHKLQLKPEWRIVQTPHTNF